MTTDHPEVVTVAEPVPVDAPAFTRLVDLASEHLGGTALATSDDFFAEVGNLVRATLPVFVEHRYTDRGKWMDGWESRRRRDDGHDWAILQLGAAGRLAGFDVDCAFFVGNAPQSCALYGCHAPGTDVVGLTNGEVEWFELARGDLNGGEHNFLEVGEGARNRVVTHLKLDIFPDGGVARLRAFGTVDAHLEPGRRVDLAVATNGGRVLGCNDEFFCTKENLVLPGPARTMGEGWETRRRRGPGHDWIVVALGAPGVIDEIVIDTSHYKGNYPDTCDIEAVALAAGGDEGELLAPGYEGWRPLVARTKLGPDQHHSLTGDQLLAHGPFTHLRLNIHPDGGIARMRVYGLPSPRGGDDA